MTLTEFLLARIAEDEENARYISENQRPASGGGSVPLDRFIAGIYSDPAHIWAECHAKRGIVETYAEGLWIDPGSDRAGWGVSAEPASTMMRHLATAYADHPDYDEEWKP